MIVSEGWTETSSEQIVGKGEESTESTAMKCEEENQEDQGAANTSHVTFEWHSELCH